MSRVLKTSLVAILAVSLMLAGPLSAVAGEPVNPTVDPPMVFTAQDMTAALSAATDYPVVEVTAICSPVGDLTLIAGIDSRGEVVLVAWDGSEFDDWTDLFYNGIGTDWTRINAISYFNEDYTVGGVRLAGIPVAGIQTPPPHAALATLCGWCYGSGEGDHEYDYADSVLMDHAAVTDLAYEGDQDALGITLSGDDGLAVMDNASSHGEGSPEFALVTEVAMAGARAPIGLYGNAYSQIPDNGTIDDIAADIAAQANTIRALTGFPYWAVGTGRGDVLAYGCDDGVNVAGQTLTTVAETTDIMSLDYDWLDNSWIVGARGEDGTMDLFRDTHVPAISLKTSQPTTTELPFPATVTVNADAEFAGYYFMVGGTGGQGHLYKYNSVYSEMIDLDYLVAGMSRVNAVKQDNGTSQDFGPFNLFGTSDALVGGSGSKTLIRIKQTAAFNNEDVVPAGEGTTADCGAGGASVTFPAGAVATDYAVIVEKVAAGTPAVPGGLSLLGASYEFKCFDTNGEPITAFNQPVTITITYDPDALNGMSEDSLVIYYYDIVDSTWKAVTPCAVDKANHTVTITVNHFTQFGILGATATTLPFTGI